MLWHREYSENNWGQHAETKFAVTAKKSKDMQIIAKPRIDSKADLIDSIDFSFKDIMNLEGFKPFI